MLHSVPALVDELEACLITGRDPLPLLASVQWNQLVGWPTDLPQARRLKARVGSVLNLVTGLQAPLRATLMAAKSELTYGNGKERASDLLPPRLQQHV